MRIRKSEWGRMITKRAGRMLTVLAAAVILVWCDPIVSRAEAPGTVLPKTVNIRKQPDQGSDPIGSSSAGKEISIRGKVEVSGVTWYQVYVDANTLGYVRADMIEAGEGDIPTVSVEADTSDNSAEADSSQADSAAAAPTGSGTGAQVQAQEEMAFQYATTKVQAKVRPDPSTSNNHIDSLTPGTQVVVSGKSEGSDGKTWYFVNYTGASGSERTGYIRSDLLDLGDLLPTEEETEPEPDVEPAAAPAAAPRNDYELKIETNSEGEEVWFLYNNISGDKMAVELLWDATGSQSVDDKKDTDAIVKQRIVIVVLGILLAALAVTVIIMAFKLRDAYYEDYEDDEDEEEERNPGRKTTEKARQERRRAAVEEEDKTVRRRERAEQPRGERAERPDRTKREREVTYQEEPEAVRPTPKRKTKNFLMDDDEFEFEFLNMDDKDMK